MSTKRAREHKDLVESEKKYHHLSGTHYSWLQKKRYVNLSQANAAEASYEWHKREKRNPKLAQELNELFSGGF